MVDQEKQHLETDFVKRFFGGDRVLWIIIAILAIVSLLVVYSSTASMAYRRMGGDTSHYVIEHFKFIILGFIVTYIIHRINYQVYVRFTMIAFVFALGFMVMTFFMGVNLNDASRWIRIPVIGLTFQPSDFLKVALVMFLARELAIRQNTISKSRLIPPIMGGGKGKNNAKEIFLKTTLPLLMPIILACGAVFFSNLSTSVIIFITSMLMLYIGRVKVSELWRVVGLAFVAASLAITIMAALDIGRARTWVNRITNFTGISQSEEKTDKDKKEDSHIMQANIAIASGGILGKGPGRSTQRANLPNSYSDYAYAFIIEEYGLLGAIAVLMLYLWIFFRSILIFRRCGTAFPSLLVLGLGLMILLQGLSNMMVSVGLTPVTGQVLPIISLGGSSMLFISMSLGMILGVSRQTQEQTLDKPRNESLLE